MNWENVCTADDKGKTIGLTPRVFPVADCTHVHGYDNGFLIISITNGNRGEIRNCL